jgi:hypothetical protein
METIREADKSLSVLADNPPVVFDSPPKNPTTSIPMNLGPGIRSLTVARCDDRASSFLPNIRAAELPIHTTGERMGLCNVDVTLAAT